MVGESEDPFLRKIELVVNLIMDQRGHVKLAAMHKNCQERPKMAELTVSDFRKTLSYVNPWWHRFWT